ncbi:immunoglobulin-like domain-containing protein, partial [Persephonella sp.]
MVTKRFLSIFVIVSLFFASLFIASCGGGDNDFIQTEPEQDRVEITSENPIISPPNIVEVSSETPSTVSIHFLPAQVDGLLKIENYLVYISTDKESLFNENSQPAVILNPDELSTKIENLSPETKYYVAVIAKTTNGFKRISNIMEITTISSENILRDDVNIPAVEYLNASDLIIVEEDKEFILDRDLQIGSLIVVEDIENLVYELYKIEDIKPHEIDKYKAVVSKQNVSELFKSLSISTKVNMIDLPQNIESQNTGRISVLFLNSSEGNNITYDWKDGFIMQNIFYGKNITSKKISAASEKEEVAEDGDYICYKKHTDDYEVNFCLPKNFKVGQTYKIPIDVSLIKDYRYKESGFTSNLPSGFVEYFSYKCSEYNRSAGYFDNLYQFVWKYYASVRYDAECMIKKDARIDVCSFEFKRIFPTDEDLERDSYAPIYYLERLNEIPVVKEENGKLYFLWTPNHLDSFGGYSYRFKIKAGVFCEYEDMKHEFDELEFETDIVFTSDAYRIDSIQNVSFSDEVDIGNLNIEYSLSPELDIYYDKGKKYARVGISVNPFLKVSMEGSFEEESGKLFGPFPLLSKQFVKIVPTTVGVPIVVITRLNLMATAELKTSANFTGLIEGTASGSLGYTIEIKDGEINSPSSENTMTVNLVAKGTSNVVADLKLHMYPSIEVSLYDAVGTQLVLDPYLYSNLSLMTEGVSYTELWLYDNGNDFYYHNNQYFDYWFENIEVGGALDAYFFAGIDWVFLEYSYPKDARWASHDLPIAAASFMNPKHRVFLKKYYFDILGYENIKNAIGESAALNLINEIDSKISDDKYKENLNTNYSGYKKFSIFKYPFIVLPEFSITFKPEEKPPTYINSTAIKVVSSSADFDLKNLRYIEKIIKDDNGNYWVVPDFNIVSVSGEISLRGVNSGTFRQIDDESMSIELDDSGVALYWLNRYGISSLDLDKDLDGDGFSNKEEFFAGTDPTDKTSTPYPYIYSIVENNSLTEIPIYDEQIFQDYVTVTAGREITLDTLVVLPRSYDGDTNVEILSPDGNVLQNCNIPNDNLLNVDLPFFDKELFQLCKFTIRPETSGYYTITLNFTDGNDKEFIYLKVVEEDTIHPEIILKGDNPLYLNLGEIYEEPGYEAVDNVDGDITHKVLVVEDVDETKEGEYKITYLVKDSAGNEATQSRTVIVQKPTNRPPIITNITPDTTINYGDTVLLEVTAYDPEGSGLTITWSDNGNTVRSCISSSCTVKVEPTMDTIYTVDVQDFEGNTITKSVSIKVKQPEYFLQLDAYLNPITIDVLEGYTQNITLTVSTSYENLSNLKCWYELNNVRKDINCNTSVSIPVDVSLTGTNYIEVFAQGITPDNKTYTASKTLTLTVNVKEKNYTLTFISENYPDDTVFNINEDISSIDKRWTFRMTDTHGATLIVEKDSSKPCNLEINGSLPQITVNPSEEFDINISFVFPAKEGEFECYFKIRDTEGNYYNTDSVDSFWIKFKVVANSLIASINTNAKTVLINEPVYLIISIKDGNPPYTVDINWGDGNADSFEFSETEKVVAHTYTIEGNHRITATIVDNAGKTYETNIDISVSSQVQQQTQWTGKVTKNTDTTIEIPADITVTPKTTADGATYYEYSINYTPTNPDEIYYSSYTLPVPKDVLNLS